MLGKMCSKILGNVRFVSGKCPGHVRELYRGNLRKYVRKTMETYHNIWKIVSRNFCVWTFCCILQVRSRTGALCWRWRSRARSTMLCVALKSRCFVLRMIVWWALSQPLFSTVLQLSTLNQPCKYHGSVCFDKIHTIIYGTNGVADGVSSLWY